VDAVDMARWGNALLLGCLLVLVSRIVYEASNRSLKASVVGVLLSGSSLNVLQAYGFVWAETLFLVLVLLWAYLLKAYMEGGRYSRLALATAAMSAVSLTRYAGVTLLAAHALIILTLSKKPMKVRIVESLASSGIGALPLGLWMVRNYFLARTATSHPLTLHLFGLEHLKQTGMTLLTWLVPPQAPLWARMPATVFLIAAILTLSYCLIAFARSARTRGPERKMPLIERILAIWAAVYLPALVVMYSMVDIADVMNGRMLLPLQLTAIILLVGWASRSFAASGTWKAGRLAATAAVVAIVAASMFVGAAWSVYKFRHGIGFCSQKWVGSGIVDRVAGLPADAPMWSNFPEAVHCMTGRVSCRTPDAAAQEQWTHMRDSLNARGGLVILFAAEKRSYSAAKSNAEQTLVWAAMEHKAIGDVYVFGTAKSP
jgi:hypothetical protein